MEPAMTTVIVTGANSGLGFEAASELCKRGYDVVISTRDDKKGEETVKRIKEDVPNAAIMYLVMEMSEPDSIRSFVENFKATNKPLHVLLNNAGLYIGSRNAAGAPRGDNSLEMAMVVNCMGTFLLTHLLLDRLKETGTAEKPARIVNVSSSLVKRNDDKPGKAPFYIDDIMLAEPDHYQDGMHGYSCSKVALNLWTNELAKKLDGSHVIINSLCPGFIPSTELSKHMNTGIMGRLGVGLLRSALMRFIIKDIEPISTGRQRLVEMAVEEKFGQTNGKFYQHGEVTPEPSAVMNEENQKKIWDICVKYSGL